jgi:hypothetical protein
MGKYGECAVLAVDRITNSLEDPKTAWKNAAVAVFPLSKSSQAKGCPKGAFLGLCGEGFVKGVEQGHALDAIKILKNTPRLSEDPYALWHAVPSHASHDNGQMDVVISLWRNGLIV